MNKLIENCLFLKDKDRFNILRTKASDFRNTFIGETIVRDSIFDVIQKIEYDDSNLQPDNLEASNRLLPNVG